MNKESAHSRRTHQCHPAPGLWKIYPWDCSPVWLWQNTDIEKQHRLGNHYERVGVVLFSKIWEPSWFERNPWNCLSLRIMTISLPHGRNSMIGGSVCQLVSHQTSLNITFSTGPSGYKIWQTTTRWNKIILLCHIISHNSCIIWSKLRFENSKGENHCSDSIICSWKEIKNPDAFWEWNYPCFLYHTI